jgi:hypothetical protein
MRLEKIFLMMLIALAISQVGKSSQATEVTGQTLNISGRRVSLDETGSQYLATGGARAFIEGEKAAVDADEIRYCHEQRNFAADEQRNSAAGCASLSKYSLTRF